MFRLFKSNFYNFEATRILSSTSAEGCEIAEFLEAMGKVGQHDPETWYTAWHEQSQRAETIAREAVYSGYVDAARGAFLRASNYARASSYMFPWSGPDERFLRTAERSITLFREAIPYMDSRVMVLEIPYQDDVTMPAYLYLPAASRRMRGNGLKRTPIIVSCGGADSTQEELYFVTASAGVSLGYAVLTFEGPGQGLMLKKGKTAMRPDFEAVSSRVLDYLQHLIAGNPELGLDAGRIAVVGVSLGGYFALRSSIDARIKACVAVDPFYGLWRLALKRMPAWLATMWTSGWLPDQAFNALIYLQAVAHFPTQWEMGMSMAIMGASTPGDMLRRCQSFDLDVAPDGQGKITDRIRCPVLLTGASSSVYASPDESTVVIYNALSQVPEERKEMWIPKEVGQGGLTAKVGAWKLLAQKSFQFLDKHLHVERTSKDNGDVPQS
ncbi:Alpha/Beta hydrolase protein [Chaetomium fimeti]|uniref:Alpha/Beta hydrolase protein n=1 Tax=Chaetomium fimeti TaxID=1854472 RepID=A0AAE0HHL7_9PEZI|nr:Alpha/Beta hydrolase protein [Chaetomium fimeti]